MLQRIGIIIGSTLNDELHQKSMYLLTGLAILFVLLLRGCFDNEVVMNGQRLDGVTIGWHASLAAFHIIAGAGVFVAILLGMRVLQRDRSNGTTTALLSKPVSRLQYIVAKVIGVWLLAYGLTFVLHLTVYGIMLLKTGGRIGMFIPASLIIAINVFCIVTLVMLLSSVLPDIAAALCCAVVWLVGYVNDTMFVAAQNEVVKSMLHQMQAGGYPVALWRLFWPKLTAVQYFAVGLIKESEVIFPGPLHPLLNVALYAGVAFLLLLIRFSRSEIR
jgi:ABC-type transport system involved in multi-copper enzyme maturation permease subunit